MTTKTFFDLLISIGILGTTLPAVLLLWHGKRHPASWEARPPWLTRATATLLLLGTAVLIWGSFIEPRLLTLTRHTVDLPQITRPIRIVAISDFQAGTYRDASWVTRVVEHALLLDPDLVMLIGD